jgi:hypothetical protein
MMDDPGVALLGRPFEAALNWHTHAYRHVWSAGRLSHARLESPTAPVPQRGLGDALAKRRSVHPRRATGRSYGAHVRSAVAMVPPAPEASMCCGRDTKAASSVLPELLVKP